MKQQFEQTLSHLFPTQPNGLEAKEIKALEKLRTNFLSTSLTALLKFRQHTQDEEIIDLITKELLNTQTLSNFLENNFSTPSIYFNTAIFKPYLEKQNEKELSYILKNTGHPVIQTEVQAVLTQKSAIIPLLPLFDKLVDTFKVIEAIPAEIKRNNWNTYQEMITQQVQDGEFQKIMLRYRETKKVKTANFTNFNSIEATNYNSVEVEQLQEKVKIFQENYLRFFSDPEHWAYIGDLHSHSPLRASYGFSSTTVFNLVQKSDKELLAHVINTGPAKEIAIKRFLSQVYFNSWATPKKPHNPLLNKSAQHFYSFSDKYIKANMLDKALFITDKIGVPYIFEAFLGEKQYSETKHLFAGKTTGLQALQALDAYFINEAPKYQRYSNELKSELDKVILNEFIPEQVILTGSHKNLQQNTTFKI